MNDALMPVEHDPFAGPALTARVPLTEAQREIWLSVQTLSGVELAYNECGTLTLKGSLHRDALLRALQTLVDRHEVLRSSFSPDGEWMCVHARMKAEVTLEDISEQPEEALRRAEQSAVRHQFDLEKGPLIRWTLLRANDQLHYLIKSAHHIIVDGWSSWVLSNELGHLYSAYSQNREATLEAASRYGDYAQIERDFVASAEGHAHLDYWMKQLESPPNVLPMPHDRPRPAERTFDAQRVDIALDPALVSRLRKLGSQHGASLVATTLAAFVATLRKQSGQEDMIIGLAAAGQSFHQQNHLVGHAVNMLPLRLQPQAEQTFVDLLKTTRVQVLDAFDHQGVSFGSIVPLLKFERDPSRPPLVPIIFNIDVRSGDVIFEGLQIEYRTLYRVRELFELFVNMVDDGKSLLLECSYNSNLFSEEAIRDRMADYEAVLKSVCDNPQARLRELGILGDAARKTWDAFNQTARAVPSLPVHELLQVHVRNTPDHCAVVCGNHRLTYHELDEASSRLAARLQEAGAAPGSFIGVCLDRTVNLPVALLAVLKTGAAYLPLDPEFPPDRLHYYLEDSGARLLLADAAALSRIPHTPCAVVPLEGAPARHALRPAQAATDSPAYVIYTSGSTGKPKGVVIPHGALTNFMDSFSRTPGLKKNDVLGAVTTVSFDIAGLELWLPLICGATIALMDRDTAMDGELLKNTLAQHGVTVMQATPSTWRLLLAADWKGARDFRAYCGGEPLPRDLAEQLMPRVTELWNLYGPTETTIWSTVYRVTDPASPILIGRPIANTICHVLDAQGQLMSPGVTGELWIGGAGLALGYHQRAELTAEKFVRHPVYGLLYNTGDLARLTRDGLECLGRVDFQVKLRGYRIELGEIEYVLSRQNSVAESAVLVKDRAPGDPRLVAYVACKAGVEMDAAQLREQLRNFLPPYMVPQQFVLLEQLPRLPNGKLDRKALPDPFASQRQAQQAKSSPVTGAEMALADLWKEILSVEAVALEDRFFDLGGHSLLAVRVVARLKKQYGAVLQVRHLMMEDLRSLALRLPAMQSAASTAVPVVKDSTSRAVPETTSSRTPGFLQRLLGKSRS